MRLRFLAETTLFRGMLGAASVLPRGLLRGAGGLAGDVARRLDRRHARITRDNLALALGQERTPDELERIARACWRNFGRNIADTLYFPRFGPDSIGKNITYEGREHIEEAYAAGKGVLLFSGHFGHWELTALMQGHIGLPLTLITRRLDNPSLERLLADMRGASGNRIVHKHEAAREMMRDLRAGRGIAIVIDQDARWSGVFVPFFGRLASTTPTLARLALRTGARVIPTFSLPDATGDYRVVYEPAVPAPDTGDLEADTLQLTARCTAIVEAWVRRYPEQWLWMHRRWKTLPPDQRDGAATEQVPA